MADDKARLMPGLNVFFAIFAVVLLYLDHPDNRLEGLAALRAAFNDWSAPLLELSARPVRGAFNVGPWWERQIELASENQELRLQMAEMRAWRDAALSLQELNARYREALNLQGPVAEGRISAWTVADRSNAFVRSRLVGAGAEHGVRRGYPAVNLYGLIGRTVDVGRTSSRILLLTDLNSRVAVMADRSNARALLVGDNSDFPRLDYLGRDPDLVEGDRIVTSGDDNVMPRGLPVGEVVRDRDGRWRVALYSRAAPIDLIWIWPFHPVADPEADPAGEERDLYTLGAPLENLNGAVEPGVQTGDGDSATSGASGEATEEGGGGL